jgi:uncharacterized protein (TIGR02118 family)
VLRLTHLLRKKPELTEGQFRKYWRDHHGPLLASLGPRFGVIKYVQGHTLADPANEAMAKARGGMETPYDGVSELWFEDRDVFAEALTSPAGTEAVAKLVRDEARFIDLPQSPLWLNYEIPQVNPTPEVLVARERSTLVKLYFPIRASYSESEAQRYWTASHGPLIRRQAAGAGILRYLQVQRVADELENVLREARGVMVEPYMGHAELWFDRVNTHIATEERREANRRAIEDERKFINFQGSSIWLAKEHVLVDHF